MLDLKTRLESKTICIRLVEKSDAAFILKLRLDARYNTFLSHVSPDLAAQERWIDAYKTAEKQGKEYYFIIERHDGRRCGTIRIYDRHADSFCWGSWILNEDKTRYAALESAFLIYEFGFGELGYEKAHFDVMKGNDRVINFHLKMGAVETGHDDQNRYFTISKSAVEQTKARLKEKIS